MASDILYGLSRFEPGKHLFKFGKPTRIYLTRRLDNMCIAFRSEHVRTQAGYDGPRLIPRIQSLQRIDSAGNKILQQHIPILMTDLMSKEDERDCQRPAFSMIEDRNSVMPMPAVLTIFGTRDAAVIPGMVLTSRK